MKVRTALAYLCAVPLLVSPLLAQIEYSKVGFSGSIVCTVEEESANSVHARVNVTSGEPYKVQWTTDIPGMKGDGVSAELSIRDVAPGRHHLTFTVTDIAGTATCAIPFSGSYRRDGAAAAAPNRPNAAAGETAARRPAAMPPPPPPAPPSARNAEIEERASRPGTASSSSSAGSATPSSSMSGAASAPTMEAEGGPADLNQPVNVPVHYMTDRKRKSRGTRVGFSGKRSDPTAVSYGVAVINIPPNHRKGNVETPGFISGLVPTAMLDRDMHYMSVKAVSPQTKDQFFHSFEASLHDSDTALLFIHGYNVKFDDALLRAAQMKYDLQFRGPVLVYSWASRGKLQGYTADEETAQWSARNLAPVLQQVATSAGARRIVIVAHSMGNRVLTLALESLANQHVNLSASLKEVVLAAPDIDTGVFEQMATAVRSSASHITIYESTGDEALVASRRFHDFSRLGDATPIHVVNGYDVIDASSFKGDFLGHSYFLTNLTIMADIADLIAGKSDPITRNRWQKKEEAENSWFAPR